MTNIKKNQHYVSQFYLKAWSECGSRIYASIDKPVKMRIEKVACSNYFYKASLMNENTRKLLLAGASRLKSPQMRDYIISAINGVGLIDDIGGLSGACFNEEIKYSDNLIKTNVVEDFYTMIESLAAPEIKKILEGRLVDLDINGYQNIVRHVVNQLTRTQKTRTSFGRVAGEKLDANCIDFRTYDSFQSLIISEEILLVLLEKLYKITVVENTTEKNFITSDHPVINLNSIDISDLKLYIPISPKIALFIEPNGLCNEKASLLKTKVQLEKESPKYFVDKVNASMSEVNALNIKTWENKGRHIFAYTSKDIADVTGSV